LTGSFSDAAGLIFTPRTPTSHGSIRHDTGSSRFRHTRCHLVELYLCCCTLDLLHHTTRPHIDLRLPDHDLNVVGVRSGRWRIPCFTRVVFCLIFSTHIYDRYRIAPSYRRERSAFTVQQCSRESLTNLKSLIKAKATRLQPTDPYFRHLMVHWHHLLRVDDCLRDLGS